MNLSEIKNQLQQVSQLVEDWQEKGIDGLERDLALEKLREIYAALRFGATPQPETISGDDESQSTEEVSESSVEELPVGIAISLDDVFEGFMPEDLMPMSDLVMQDKEPAEKGHVEDIVEIEEAPSAPEEIEDVAESDEVMAEMAEETAVEPTEADVMEMAEMVEHVPEESPAEEVMPTQEPEPEHAEEPKHAEEPELSTVKEPVQEPMHHSGASMGQPSLFGDEELIVPRSSRRTRMMSLYDDEPAVVAKRHQNLVAEPEPLRVQQPEPLPQPQSMESENIEPKEVMQPVVEKSVVESATVEGVAEMTQPIVEQLEEDAPMNDDEFVEIDLSAKQNENREPGVGQATTEPVAESHPEPYIEPQIEMSEATHVANAVPESESVLGEVIKSDVRTIGDSIKPKSTTAEFIAKGAVENLGRAIGINDRFLLMRALFRGNAQLYEQTIERLNNFENLEDCMIYIVENFDWNPNSDGAKLMMELIERKYS